jgi:hypothetical protein
MRRWREVFTTIVTYPWSLLPESKLILVWRRRSLIISLFHIFCWEWGLTRIVQCDYEVAKVKTDAVIPRTHIMTTNLEDKDKNNDRYNKTNEWATQTSLSNEGKRMCFGRVNANHMDKAWILIKQIGVSR